jgi:uncharacterized protein YdaU (DUF1376 family)
MTAKSDLFDAKSARTRQPLPLWAGAFDRATKEQGPEVIGAYMLILMAMWEAKSCDLPNDEKHLAWVAKVSPTIWRRKYAPIIMPLLSEKNSRIFSEKLQENAEKTEEYCLKQHQRKIGKSEPKPLKENEPHQTVDKSADQSTVNPPDQPLPLTINIEERKEEEDARGAEIPISECEESRVPSGLLDDIRQAVGIQAHDIGPYWADATLTAHVEAWRSYGLTDDQITAEAAASRAKNPDPPDGPKALDRWMQAAARAKRNTPAHGKPVQRAEVKPPPSPEERLRFFADWVNSDKPLPPSTINNTLAHSLLEAKLVTVVRLKERGVAA